MSVAASAADTRVFVCNSKVSTPPLAGSFARVTKWRGVERIVRLRMEIGCVFLTHRRHVFLNRPGSQFISPPVIRAECVAPAHTGANTRAHSEEKKWRRNKKSPISDTIQPFFLAVLCRPCGVKTFAVGYCLDAVDSSPHIFVTSQLVSRRVRERSSFLFDPFYQGYWRQRNRQGAV